MSSARPLVSVVVPVHDGVEFIGEAIASLRAQSMTDWEAIIVDDGSTDDTPKVIATLAVSEPRIRRLRQSNAGVSAARNAGIAAARAPWVLCLDSDDWLAPDALALLTSEIAADPQADVIHGLSVRVCSERRQLTPDAAELSSDLFDRLSQSNIFVVHACLVRHSAVLEVGGFDPGLASCEDLDLWQRIARRGGRFRGIRRLVAYYRQRPGSLTTDHATLLRNWIEVIRRAHRPDPRVRAPDPRYADGAPPDGMSAKIFVAAAWCCACAIGRGQDPMPLLEQLAGIQAPDLEPYGLAVTLHDGMLFGRAEYAPDWVTLWPVVGTRVVPLIDRLGDMSGGPLLGSRVRRRLERHVAEQLTPQNGPITIDRLHVVFVDLGGTIADAIPPPDADRAYCVVMHAGRRLGVLEAPVLSRVSGAWLRHEIEQRFYRPVLDHELRRPSARFLRRGLVALVGRPGWRLARGMAGELLRSDIGPRTAVRLAIRRHLLSSGALFETAPSTGPSWYDCLKALYDEEMARPAGPAGADRWEATFSVEDPWSYSSAYEQTKYERTLSLIPDGLVGRALELACAEGHFTVQLAPRVEWLLATDISETALRRAAQRCVGATNVEFRQLDFSREEVPGGFDLVVCSEVLYFMGDDSTLAGVARRIAGALAPSGVLLMAHARTCADEMYETAFEWGAQCGARTITAAFAPIRSLALEKEIRTPLYRVQRFRRRDPDAAPPTEPEIVDLPLPREELTRELAQMVRWRGPGNQPATAGTVESLPVLMYHRIVEDAPPALRRYSVSPEAFDAQLALLRRCGRHAITLDDWRRAVARRQPLPGRPVLITFDDGYRDFRSEAWPILRRHGMTATVFLPAGRIGGAADWDELYGPAAPLLTAEEIRELRDEGIDFGAHGVSHRPMTGLSTEELVREGLRSRAVIERHLRFDTRAHRTVTALAYPYGDQDGIVRVAMNECGFDAGFATWPGMARIDGDPMNVPRIEIVRDDGLDAFSAKVGL